jgi:digeranylgeranylglycerophospholipid reductase
MESSSYYEVAVIGAGPVGSYVAKTLAEQQVSVVLIEQHKNIGCPVNCAGLVSKRVFETFQIPPDDIVQNTITTAHIHSPSGHILRIGGGKPHAYRIDRSIFDRYLANEAQKKGVELLLSEKAISLQRDPQRVNIETSKGRHIQAEIVIGADGPYSRVRDIFGFPQPKEFLRGIGAQLVDTNLDGPSVEIFIGNRIAPGFFAWLIPTNEKGTAAHIGLCVHKQSEQSLKTYFKQLFNDTSLSSFISDATISYQTGGVIPLGPLKQIVDERVVLVGDAAAQVKPTSGGGIYPGLLCARYCAQTVREAIQEQRYTTEFLQKYQDECRQEIGKELSKGMYFRKIFTGLSDQQFDRYIKRFQQKNIQETITEYGDIDYPSRLVKPLLKKTPSLLRLVSHLVT